VAGDRRRRDLSRACEQQLQPVESAGRRTRVQRGERSFVAGAQRLEERRGLARRADLADDDAVGTHPQRVRHEIRDRDAPALAGRNAFEVHRMRMREHELVRVLDDDEPLVVRDRVGERAKQRALPRPGRAAHDE